MDYGEYTYEDHDDFSISQTNSAGGGGKKKKKDKGNGSCYNSKHIRIQEEKKINSSKKK